jgi:hypothetical protein
MQKDLEDLKRWIEARRREILEQGERLREITERINRRIEVWYAETK